MIVSIILNFNVWPSNPNSPKTYENLIMKKQQRVNGTRQPKSSNRYIQYDMAIFIRSNMPIESVSDATN